MKTHWYLALILALLLVAGCSGSRSGDSDNGGEVDYEAIQRDYGHVPSVQYLEEKRQSMSNEIDLGDGLGATVQQVEPRDVTLEFRAALLVAQEMFQNGIFRNERGWVNDRGVYFIDGIWGCVPGSECDG